MAQNDNPEIFQYYYHADHLGSSSLITNLDGETVQHIEYVPFGEVFIEERNDVWNTPYLFNAKELDEETGLYYYGARYYDPRTSVWLSTDPSQEKYPNISTYAYAAQNPVRYVDPKGKDWEIAGEEKAKNTYLNMLYSATGNNYKIDENNKLVLVGADDSFKGTKSETLIKTIQTGIDSKDVYSLSLVGTNGDDENVFIDSYENKQIDISDLSKIGKASSALQGALIGHFLNEVQVGEEFKDAHAPSLNVEGKIYGELIGDRTITTRRDYSTEGAVDGYQSVIFEYNANNRFKLLQGATSISTTSYELNGVKVPFPVRTISTVSTGELKSVKKLK